MTAHIVNGHIVNGHIVVGVDGSRGSNAALAWAADEARIRETGLLVLYGLHLSFGAGPFGAPALVPTADEIRRYADDLLADARRQVTERAPHVRVATRTSARPPAEALLMAARDDASLVVVGTRGLGARAAVAVGSVSAHVAEHAACPTVVVPQADPVAPDGGQIVVGVDGSAHSDAALRFALREATLRSARIVAVHAYQKPASPFSGVAPAHNGAALDHAPMATVVEADREHTRSLVRAESSVDEAVARAIGAVGVEPDVTVRIVEGRADDVLVRLSQDAALAVVGTHGSGGLRTVLLGSVSRGVLSHSRRPVAVVRADAD